MDAGPRVINLRYTNEIMDKDSNIKFGLRITKIFMINLIILLISSTLFLLLPDLFPKYWSEIAAIFIISFIIAIILLIILTKVSKTENICEINECENKVMLNKKVCSKHDDEVVNAIRNNRIALVLGLFLWIIYFIMK
jgi:tetrahydromethanopterin S-methyltransferase subunit F